MTDNGLAAIESFKNLRRLHLENTKIGDAGLEHLQGLSNLEYLNLYGTEVTDSGLQHLSGLKNLKSLYLWQTKVTAAGVENLGRRICPSARSIRAGKTPRKPRNKLKITSAKVQLPRQQ